MNYRKEADEFRDKVKALTNAPTQEVGDVLRLAALADWLLAQSGDLRQVGNLVRYYSILGGDGRIGCVPAQGLSGRATGFVHVLMTFGMYGDNVTTQMLSNWLRAVLEAQAEGYYEDDYDGQDEPVSAVAAGGSDEGSHHAAVAG
jgi:hypothetical protein